MTAVRAFRIVSVGLALVFLLTAAPLVQAAPIPFVGFDNGANSNQPRPNSNAAQAAFSAAVGPTTLVTFESLPLGGFSSITIAPGVTLSDPGGGLDIRNVSAGSPDALFGYNTTAGGSQFVGYPGSNTTVHFAFTTPINSFGAYFTGIQSQASGQETLTFNDGSTETINLPNTSMPNGGASFVGFFDPGASITGVDITMFNDITGIDDVQFGNGAAAATPEPSTLALLGLGIAGLAGWRRWRRTA
jgi:hypothetical protein